MKTARLNEEDNFLRDLIFRESEIYIRDDDMDGTKARLLRMVKSEGLSTISDLVTELRSSNRMFLRKTIETVTINETSFFRDSAAFTLLVDDVLPKMKDTCFSKKIVLWCAGCSTGQEPYSIAIAALEKDPNAHKYFSIVASDVSPGVVDKAKSGIYSQFEIGRGVSDEIRNRYFDKFADGWKVKPEVSSLIEFRVSNMNSSIQAVPLSVDIVFLRNVMIYFNEETRKTLIGNIKRRLSPGGYLFVGSSERTLPSGNGFQRFKENGCQFYQLEPVAKQSS